MPQLHLTTPEGQEFVFNLEAPSYNVGRGEDNEMMIPDASISGHHGRFILDGDTYVLEDGGSTNGTRVNGYRLEQPVRLTPGDIVEIGNVRGIYAPEIAGIAEAAPPTPPEAPQRPGAITSALEPVVAIQTPASKAFGPKTKEKDPLGVVAMSLGLVALVACLALLAASFVMKAG